MPRSHSDRHLQNAAGQRRQTRIAIHPAPIRFQRMPPIRPIQRMKVNLVAVETKRQYRHA